MPHYFNKHTIKDNYGDMKKILTILVVGIIFLPLALDAQNYSSLWKQVKTAQDKDLPQTEYDLLIQIADKAEVDKDYGQLLKAKIQALNAITVINPDSLMPALKRIEASYNSTNNKVMKSVYAAILYKLYNGMNKTDVEEDSEAKAKMYRKAAINDVQLLAKTKAGLLSPFVVEGTNANIFGGDLLSVIGNETEQYMPLYEYYNKNGNRRAACISALKYVQKEIKENTGQYIVRKSPLVFALDSILHVYEDIDVAGEVAMARYDAMSKCKDVTTEELIGYIHYALDKWGEWQGMGHLRHAEKKLTRSMFTAEVPRSVIRSGMDVWAILKNVRNVNTVTMNLYKVDIDGRRNYSPDNANDFKFIKSRMSDYPIQTKTANFGGIPNYEIIKNDSIKIDALPKGAYLVEFSTNPVTETKRIILWVSDITTITQSLPGKKIKFVVVNSTTGHPIGGAKIDVSTYSSKNKTVTLTCDNNGEVIYQLPSKTSLKYYTYTDNDKACLNSSAWSDFNYNDSEGKEEENINIFTDRGIYRPGQKVKVAAIVYAKDS